MTRSDPAASGHRGRFAAAMRSEPIRCRCGTTFMTPLLRRACQGQRVARSAPLAQTCSTTGCLPDIGLATISGMDQSVTPDELRRILELETELQTPACRADSIRLNNLLASDFIEIGASG